LQGFAERGDAACGRLSSLGEDQPESRLVSALYFGLPLSATKRRARRKSGTAQNRLSMLPDMPLHWP